MKKTERKWSRKRGERGGEIERGGKKKESRGTGKTKTKNIKKSHLGIVSTKSLIKSGQILDAYHMPARGLLIRLILS
jgi:hypothetical protein